MVNVAFAGLKGAGKDTAADVLVKYGWHKIGMSDNIREMCRGYLRYRGVSHREIERMLDGDLKRVPSPHLEGKTPTFFMQQLGTQFGRHTIGDRIWLNSIDDHMKMLGAEVPIVISGIRFHNERDNFKDRDFTIIRIRRPGIEDPTDLHESERDVLNLKVDYEIFNQNFNTAHEFQRFVAQVLKTKGVLT